MDNVYTSDIPDEHIPLLDKLDEAVTNLTDDTDKEGYKSKIQEFRNAYNEVNTAQTTESDTPEDVERKMNEMNNAKTELLVEIKKFINENPEINVDYMNGGRRRSSTARKSSSRRGRRSSKKRATKSKPKRRQRRASRRAY